MRSQLLVSVILSLSFLAPCARAQQDSAPPAPAQAPAASAPSAAQSPQTPPAPPPGAPTRIRVGGNVEATKLVRLVRPVYPPDAKAAHIAGTVVLHAIIGKDGSVQTLEYVSGPDMLMKSAMDAVRQWRYEPLMINGQPVEVETEISVVYTLDGSAPVTSPATPDAIAAPPADPAQEPYIYESIHAAMRYDADGTGSTEITARIRVQSFLGVEQMGQLVFEYNSENQRMKIRSVRVTKPDGHVIAAGPDAVQDLSGPVAQLAPVYTDSRQKHVTVPGLSAGDVLEYDIVKTTFQPLTPGQFWDGWDFISEGICQDEEVDLDIPASVHLQMKSPEGLDPTVNRDNGHTVYHWHSTNSTAVDSASINLPSTGGFDPTQLLEGAKHPQPRQLYFSTFQDWQSVGRWYAALEKDRRVATPEVRTKADEVVQGAKTDREKAVAIYGYVARNIRYVSLSFGVGRFQPHAAADVLANQYGDCKDKATLLGAMLAAEGIHSSTALINSEADIDKSVPTPGQFDHAITIATVDGHDVWLDSTQAVGPYGYLLPQLRGKDALVADAERTSALATTPSQIPNPRLYKVSLEGTANDKTADLEMSFDVQGDDLEVVLRAMLLQLPAERLMALFNQQFKASAASRDSSWSDLKTSDPLDTKTALHFQARVTGETESADSPTDANAKSGDGTSAIAEILDSGLLSYVMSDPPKDSGAALPVSVGGPKEISLHLRVTNTDDKSQSFLMQPVDLKKDFAEYHGKASWDGNTLTADLDLNLLLKEIPAERAQEYVDFRRAVIESFGASGKKIVLAEEYQNGLDAYRARDLKRSADLLESVLQQDPSYKDAWNNLGRTYLDIGNLDQAEADFRKAIQNDPNDLYAYNNLGLTFLREQKYDEAIPQFQKQIEINAKDQYAHANLGKAYVQSQKYEDAVKELEIAQSLTPRDSTVAANLGIAYARLGRTDDAKRAFDTDLALDISPNRYDTLATQLADAGLELDLAEKYVQTAIDSEVSQLKTTSLDSIVPDDIRSAETLSERWNTLGWIKLQQGDTATAEKYMLAARQSALFIGANNHLGELYEKEGRKADAIHQYELDLILSSRDSATRTRLAALLGGDQNIDKQLDDLRKSHGVQLALQLPNPEKLDGRAYFYMLFSPGSDTPEIKLGSGDSDPRYQAKLRSQVSQFAPPEPLNVKLLRSAIVICTTPTNSCLIENGGPIRRPNSIPPLEPSGTLHRCRPRHPRARVPRSHLTNHLRQATA